LNHQWKRITFVAVVVCLSACDLGANEKTANPATPAVIVPAAQVASVSDLSERINQLITEKRTPGMVLMIVKDGKVLLHEAYGYADLEQRRPQHKDDIFRLYSMSKPITAAALLKLVEQGKLALDTPLHQVLPEFAGRNPVTMRQLLTHTAGFPYGGSFGSLTGWRYWLANPLDESNTLAEMTESLAGLPPMHEPGEQWLYGMASDVQGAVIEKVSGEPLEQFLGKTLFQPLGMKDTAFFVDTSREHRLAANYSYDKDAKQSRRDDDGDKFTRKPTLTSGGGGLVGTAEDYMRFVQLLLEPETHRHILAPTLVHAMTSNQLPTAIATIPQQIYPDTGFGFGLGVKLRDAQYLRKGSMYWAGKGGTLFWADPQKKLAVVAMMQLQGARAGLEKRLVPWIYEWLEAQR
jgi:CubicO group peptidase (beta-lactamase class C family)